MTVSKEALFERYKKLKSEGVSVSLMELKKQMEAEEQANTEPSPIENTIPSEPTPMTAPSTGFSALSQTKAVQSSFVQDNSPAQIAQSSGIQTVSTPSDYSNSQNNSWTTSYYSQSSTSVSDTNLGETQNQEEQTVTPTQSVSTTPSYEPKPIPQVSEQAAAVYSNNFSGNYSFNNTIIHQGNVNTPSTIQLEAQPFQHKEFPKPEQTERNKYCLIGYPLGHSLSTFVHDAGFKSLGLNCSYELLETPPEKLVERIKYLKYNNFAGFNVTIPLKLPVTMFLDEIDISADLIGAVNTVVINNDLTLKGYNTDVLGFRNAIGQDVTLAGKTIGVLGTGGAARAAITAFAQEQVKQIKIYTRNVPNSVELLTYLRQKFPLIEFNAFQIEYIRDLSDIDILVNTTPIGMQGRAADLTPVEENELKTLPQNAIVYDVIYNPRKTLLLKLAQKNGYKTINGVDMFIHQALAAEQIWTGKTPDFKDMKIAALENL